MPKNFHMKVPIHVESPTKPKEIINVGKESKCFPFYMDLKHIWYG